jgi:hypothetical protein
MDTKQYGELITTIRNEYEQKICRLKQEMDKTITTLENLFELKAESPQSSTIIDSTPLIRTVRVTNISVPKRMMIALNKTKGDFGRLELFEMINNDETGIKSPTGTLSIAFSNLQKNGDIIEVRKPRGTIKGVYRRADKSESHTENSPVSEVV